ncbi:MAG: prepilin-type N-terminal cleavage/methylation domain-containing protein, partial [Candidatus Eremiobacterota bacterium]
MRAPSRNGLTLVETLISMALLGLMLGATYAALVLSLRYYQRTREAADVQKETLVTVNRIERALASAAQDSVSVDPTGIVFASAETSTGVFAHDPSTGKPLWQRYVCFYTQPRPNNVLRLFRQDRLLTTPSTDFGSVPSIDSMKQD